MTEFKDTVVLAATALVLAAAGVLAWIAGLAIGGDSSLVRGGLVFTGLALVGGAGWVAVRRTTRSVQEAYRLFDLLSRMNEHELLAADDGGQLPELPASHPWSGVHRRLKESLTEATRRCNLAEHQRASQEIRVRGNEARCERVEAILASLHEPVLAVDAYDELVLANPSAERLFDFQLSGTSSRAVARLLQCEKLREMLGETRKRRAAGVPTEEVELAGPDGRLRWYSITVSSLNVDDSVAGVDAAPAGAVAVLRDVSNQKAIQKRNAEFVSAVSHEMKTPLAGIKAYVEMLLDGEADNQETQEEFLNVINGQADRLRRLIDNLLNLARIESGVVKVVKTNCSLNEMLDEAMSVVKPSADHKRIELATDLSPLYINALADRDQILQTAINLLSNAIKYTHDGGRVTLHSRLVDGQAQFDVEDTGVGLSEEDCEKVFEKFYRVQKDKQMAAGTGLGLPLAKYIVEDVHGGRLTLTSKLDAGSTFTVTLPRSGDKPGGQSFQPERQRAVAAT